MATRENTINLLLDVIPKDALVISCNGRIGRELWELRKQRGESTDDFIMIGAMGCALPLALGLAMNTTKQVVLLIGDGNFLMKMGALATYLKYRPQNLKIYIINNDRHDSTGGQPTSFSAIRRHLPYSLHLRMVDVEPGSRDNLGRPELTPQEITARFRDKVRAKPVETLIE